MQKDFIFNENVNVGELRHCYCLNFEIFVVGWVDGGGHGW